MHIACSGSVLHAPSAGWVEHSQQEACLWGLEVVNEERGEERVPPEEPEPPEAPDAVDVRLTERLYVLHT